MQKNLYENLNLAAIGAPSEFIKGNTMTLGSLGDVYVTLNPTANDFTGVRAKLVNSLDQTILEDLVLARKITKLSSSLGSPALPVNAAATVSTVLPLRPLT